MRSFRSRWRVVYRLRDMRPFTRKICQTVTVLKTRPLTSFLREHYVVVTKDEDFVDTFLLRHEPYKLLLIATGNITNDDLERLFQHNLESIIQAFNECDFIELQRTALICRL